MIYLELLIGFLKVGLFSFGGAYAAIPLIRDVVLKYGWLDNETLTYFIAVCESTPGPIMINLATYVGSSQGGFLGALLATLVVALPAFIIILLVMGVFRKVLDNRYVQAVINGLKPCIIGIILATGGYMIVSNCVAVSSKVTFDWRALVITALLAGIVTGAKKIWNKKIAPIPLIIIAAILGILIYII